jgi:hypothetical protein
MGISALKTKQKIFFCNMVKLSVIGVPSQSLQTGIAFTAPKQCKF